MSARARFLLVCGLLLAGYAHGEDKNAGTSGATFLKIGAGARPAGMGEAYTAVGGDVNSLAWNPAGLGRMSSAQFTAMHGQWFQDSSYEFMAAAYPTSWGTLGFGFTSMTVDEIEKRTADTDEADGLFDSRDSAYSLSYGKLFNSNLALGLGVTYINQDIDGQTATGLSGNAGFLWRPASKALDIGLAVRHFGSEVKFDEEGSPLPMTVSLGLSGFAIQDRLLLSADVSQPRDRGVQFAAGGEWSQPVSADLTGKVRGGYNTAGTDAQDGLSGVSVGLGLTWHDWGFDMAWVPYGSLGNTFRYALLVKF